VRVSIEILDVIAKHLAAAKLATDRKVRLVYLAEARIELEEARKRCASLGHLVDEAEGEFARVHGSLAP
jgi:hypothetical protein